MRAAARRNYRSCVATEDADAINTRVRRSRLDELDGLVEPRQAAFPTTRRHRHINRLRGRTAGDLYPNRLTEFAHVDLVGSRAVIICDIGIAGLWRLNKYVDRLAI